MDLEFLFWFWIVFPLYEGDNCWVSGHIYPCLRWTRVPNIVAICYSFFALGDIKTILCAIVLYWCCMAWLQLISLHHLPWSVWSTIPWWWAAGSATRCWGRWRHCLVLSTIEREVLNISCYYTAGSTVSTPTRRVMTSMTEKSDLLICQFPITIPSTYQPSDCTGGNMSTAMGTELVSAKVSVRVVPWWNIRNSSTGVLRHSCGAEGTILYEIMVVVTRSQ